MRIVVDLPAPFGPTNPVMRPEASSNDKSSTTVCRCNGVTKGVITACWLAGARTTEDVAERTRATTGCGTCRDTIDGIVSWLASTAETRSDSA